ncbi:MAG: hypothetical protein RIF41_34995 [Polyangiaceae bacterium]
MGFESDGPPKARCELTSAEDGTAALKSVDAQPAFTAELLPDADYGYAGRFDLACDEPWCGLRELTVHEVGELDFRVTVARSDEGPPSVVLWVTCE